MADCSKTEVFVREYRRMCKSYSECWKCPVQLRFGSSSSCSMRTLDEIDILLSIVQKWSDSNPIKTRQSEFLKVFPNAHLINGVINICPKTAFFDFGYCPTQKTCDNCRKEYWLTEVK